MNFITLAPQQQTSSLPMILMLGGLFVVFYFFMIRPQKKREKEEQKMRSDLKIGDEVISIGGICGRVVALKDDSLILESPADHSKTKLLRTAIQANLTKQEELKKEKEKQKAAKAKK